jgi:hypothetical protein
LGQDDDGKPKIRIDASPAHHSHTTPLTSHKHTIYKSNFSIWITSPLFMFNVRSHSASARKWMQAPDFSGCTVVSASKVVPIGNYLIQSHLIPDYGCHLLKDHSRPVAAWSSRFLDRVCWFPALYDCKRLQFCGVGVRKQHSTTFPWPPNRSEFAINFFWFPTEV